MPESDPFADLVRRVRAGDQEAATVLVQRYESHIRRAVRMQLRDPRLRRLLDSIDVCQSVLSNFLVRAALGQFELDSPENLLKLLTKMARNKLAALARGPIVRDRVEQPDDSRHAPPAPGASPSQQVAGRELLDQVRKQLTDDERAVIDRRLLGHAWEEIAAELGESAEAVRKRYTRALDRVTQQLGLEESGDE
jgi:RNA polymerase sigma-70 factor (ECF subfamily)